MTRRRGPRSLSGASLFVTFEFVLLASVAVAGLALPSPARAATTWSVRMQPDGMGAWTYDPQVVVVNVGDTVNWTDLDGIHTTTSLPGQAESWDSGLLYTGGSFVHTFSTPGTYAYSSTTDNNMIGQVTVQAPVPEFPGSLVFCTVLVGVAMAMLAERRLGRLRSPV
jgi:plastocyanin